MDALCRRKSMTMMMMMMVLVMVMVMVIVMVMVFGDFLVRYFCDALLCY